MFGMFSGEIKTVTFEADRGLIDVIFDKFGNRVEIFRTDKEKIHCKVEVQAGPMFIAWCCSFDSRLRVTTPPSVVKMVKDHLTKTLEQYK
ncbi:MAG: WYL domain-containing protein [Clostridia bacterium]|nr:WYL domain-containing protein [Clostridia bacterium]